MLPVPVINSNVGGGLGATALLPLGANRGKHAIASVFATKKTSLTISKALW